MLNSLSRMMSTNHGKHAVVPKGKRMINVKRQTASIVVILIVYLFWRTVRYTSRMASMTRYRQKYGYPPQLDPRTQTRRAWKNLSSALESARPVVSSVGPFDRMYTASSEEMNGAPLDHSNVLALPKDKLESLAQSHDIFRKQVESGQLTTVSEKNKHGIVITADGKSLPGVLLQLRLLRHMGSLLSVEVFLRSYEDMDVNVCQGVFKLLQAECRVMEEFFDIAPLPRLPEQFLRRIIRTSEPLHKFLAIYFSSFQSVLLLDSSTIAANKPDDIFLTEPFLSTGMVLWPDFWANTESSLLAPLQSRPASSSYKNEDIRSVDLSQLLISKDKHGESLLFAIYYASFGQNLYDSLSRQGVQGQPDAEAIRQGAKAAQLTYYMCQKYTEAIGFPQEEINGHPFKGVAGLQSHPMDDYHGVNKWGQRPLFITQKLLPDFVVDDEENFVFKKSQAHHRMWEWFGARDRMNDWGSEDPEQFLWNELEIIACQEYKNLRHWPAEEAVRACKAVQHHIEKMGWSPRGTLLE